MYALVLNLKRVNHEKDSMETNNIKHLIGSECMVIDPRSRKKEFEPAKIISIMISIEKHPDGSIHEYMNFYVKLEKITISKSKRFVGRDGHHRRVYASIERIKLKDKNLNI